MRFLKHALAIVAAAFVIAACSTTSDDLANAQIGTNDAPDGFAFGEAWDGRGTDSERCDYLGQEGRTSSGWIHWVYATKGDSGDARLVLGGSGEGTYEPGPPADAAIWHFYTPFFELDGLTADIYFDDEPGVGGGLVISDFCPGVPQDEETLVVSKDVVTSFTRTHDWSIAKSVDPGKLDLHHDGSGDDSVTWTIEVAYEGFEDSGWNVSGSILIENTGEVDATITGIDDVLAGTPIDLDCPVEAFPTSVAAGATLTCTYDEDVEEAIEGSNMVTVTSERDSYGDEKPIVWGDPTTELHGSVQVDDVSDLHGATTLGTVTAPDGDVFTYSENVAWSDFGSDACDSERSYDNTASLIGDGDAVLGTAEATLVVTIRCDEPEDDVLDVSKTAHATYQRTHHWDVDKRVDEEHLTLSEDGSGDGTVTWTIEVDYLGATDTMFTIFGEVEIQNVSQWTTRTVESVTDDLGIPGVASFAVTCELDEVAVSLPYELAPGDALTCGYSRDVSAYVDAADSGTNTATVVADGEDGPLTATDAWTFTPTSETNASVYLWDYSDLVYNWTYLGQFDAPQGGSYSYDHHFAWSDYDHGDRVKCGEHTYSNWAKLFPDRHPASFEWDQALDVAVASVTVDVVCDAPTHESDKDVTDDGKDAQIL